MESMLWTLPFALLMAAQFLGAIVLISKREAIYDVSDPREPKRPPAEPIKSAAVEQKLEAKAIAILRRSGTE